MLAVLSWAPKGGSFRAESLETGDENCGDFTAKVPGLWAVVEMGND